MSNEMFTQLPAVTSATLNDIICAVQANVSVQETLGQVANLMLTNTILNYAGNPNGFVAGKTFQLLWDTSGAQLYICTISGSSAFAVWTLIQSNSGITWNEITATSVVMIADAGYVTNNASLVSLTLPVFSPFGSYLNIVGKGSGGFRIIQGGSQSIHLGDISSTVGIGGSISSTNQFDSIELVCTTTNTTWTANVGPQGNFTIV